MRRLVELGIASACGVAIVTGCSASGPTAAKDVSITACVASPTGGHPTATGLIVNHSSKTSGYTIQVKFSDTAGNGVGDGLAAVAKVGPGSTATWHANGTVDAKGPLKCTLSSVTRSAAP